MAEETVGVLEALLDGIAPEVGPELVTAVVDSSSRDVARVRLPTGRKLILPVSDWLAGQPLPRPGDRVVGVVMEGAGEGTFSVAHRQVAWLAAESVVPECWVGSVRVMGVARTAGVHTKVALAATSGDVNPVTVGVGKKANRVRRLRELLGGERVDVVAWHPDVATYVANALAPAPVERVEVGDGGVVVARVKDSQLASAVGVDGTNVRLASQLTGVAVRVAGLSQQGGNQNGR